MKTIIRTVACTLVLITVILSLLALSAAAADVTEIKTVADLKAMKANGHYKLAKDLTLTESITLPAFSGTFDGNGKTVSGITAPLFAELSGEVKNLTLKGTVTSTSTGAVGALANTVSKALTVDGLTVDVTVNAASATNVGGLIGEVTASSVLTVTVKNSETLKAVSGKANVGGFVGAVKNTASAYTTVIFDHCINQGAVSMTSTADNIGVGGFVGFGGRYSDVVVEYCSNAGDISSKGGDNGVGGIYGGGTWTGGDAQKFTARYTSNYGNVTVPTARGRAGGICGRMNRHGAAYLIEYCYNVGSVSAANDSASGIFSYSNSSAEVTIRGCYNVGILKNASRLFPIAGHGAKDSVTASENYYIGTKPNYDGENVTAVEKSDAVSLNTALLALDGSPYIVDPSENNGYAILAWECEHRESNCLGNCLYCNTPIPGAPKRDHRYSSTTVPPTATADGYTVKTCSLCGDIQTVVNRNSAYGFVVPDGNVYAIAKADQLLWVFAKIESGELSPDLTISLTDDIDVNGKLPTLTKTFTGSIDGNGKTVSSLSNTMFLEFNGSVRSLILGGNIDYSASSYSFDVSRKAASFAHNTSSAFLQDVISYVNIKTSRNDINAGGLVGYAKDSNSFIGCAYYGTYTAVWTGDGAGIGGIVGWSNAAGGTTTFEDCLFGGKITVTAGAVGKEASIGGILGNCTNAKVILRGCLSNGTIESNVTSGTDFVGGIVGVNRNTSTLIEQAVNRSTLTAKSNAGGIFGGVTVDTTVSHAANYGSIKADVKGALLGTAGAYTVTLTKSCDLAPAALSLVGAGSSVVIDGSFSKDETVDLQKEVTFNGITYKRYNFGVTEKESGKLMPTLSTDAMFTPYITIRDDGKTHAIRFVFLTNRLIPADSVTVSILFKDKAGKTVKTKVDTLALENGDYQLYSAVNAAGETYFAASGQALFGCVITDIPNGAWDSLVVTVENTKTGTAYMTPSGISISDMQFDHSVMPDLSVMGTVSSGRYNAGPGLMNDETEATSEDCFVKVITHTTAAKLASYVKNLEANGFRKLNENTLDGDTYYTYEKQGALYYLYHNTRIGETRVIVDNASDPLSMLTDDYIPKSGDTTEFYQYSINYDFANVVGYDPVVYTESSSANCGMCYIIKLADNSVIVIDGGHEKQSTAKSRAGLVKFLRKITDTPDGEKVKVAMWYFTHAHGDHVRFAADVLNAHSKDIELMSVTHNFTSYQEVGGGYDDNTFLLKNVINRRYPDVLFHKLHTGEVLTMAGVTLEVVYTHEDAITASAATELGDYNSSSTVLKITIDGKSIMLLADISDIAESAIVSMHSQAYLKSDAVQAAHHCFNYLNRLYPIINADIALFPQSMFYLKDPNNGQSNLYKYQQVMTYATREYFAHKYTYKFTVVDGEVVAEALPRYDAE